MYIESSVRKKNYHSTRIKNVSRVKWTLYLVNMTGNLAECTTVYNKPKEKSQPDRSSVEE